MSIAQSTPPVATGGVEHSGLFQLAALSHPGRVRANNEDSVRWESPNSMRARAYGVLAMVADGVGGHAAGEVASALAVDVVLEQYYDAPSDLSVVRRLAGAIRGANTAIWEAARADDARAGMATTMTAAVVQPHEVLIGHVGDSRAYLLHGETVAQISRDHSLVAEQVEAGLLTAEQARHHPQRNVISRALGLGPQVSVDLYVRELAPGDVIVLCSDGLSNCVTAAQLLEAVRSTGSVEAAADQLVSRALAAGAPDNVSLVVIRQGRTEPVASRRRASRRPLFAASGVAAVALALSCVNVGMLVQQHERQSPTPEVAAQPTPRVTVVLTPKPTEAPTSVPTPNPTELPTSVPTPNPTELPTSVPTSEPTAAPTTSPLPSGIPQDQFQPGPLPGQIEDGATAGVVRGWRTE